MSDSDLLTEAYRLIERAEAKAPLSPEAFAELEQQVEAIAARARVPDGVLECTGEQLARLDPAAQRFIA